MYRKTEETYKQFCTGGREERYFEFGKYEEEYGI